MTDTPYIITSAIDGETYDLTKNRIRLDLLPDDVARALVSWPHGLSVWIDGLWFDVEIMRSMHDNVYRARPAPKVTEHVLWWSAGDASGRKQLSSDTHKITMRFIGDTLPYEVFTSPSGATFTVEKAQ